MEHKQLIEQLERELTQTLDCEVKKVELFALPVHTIDVAFSPILKKRMDILMKILLSAVKSGQFQTVQELSEMLHVEALFVTDLLEQMVRSKLILVLDGFYTLTENGEKQLAEGVYEEQLEEEVVSLLYSPVHDGYFRDEVEDMPELEELVESLIEESELTIYEEAICDVLQEMKREVDPSIYVLAIGEATERQIHDIPYVGFVCYDRKADRYFIRAHSFLTNEWDDVAEGYLTKEKLVEWK